MIEQIVVNLAVNARDAMPKGGELMVTTREVEVTEADVRAKPERRAGKFARLSVADTGCGMDAAVIDHLFEPFFTTKEVGKGVGLGLATVYGMVKQHQGWIEVESQPGQRRLFPHHPALDGEAGGKAGRARARFPKCKAARRSSCVVEDED